MLDTRRGGNHHTKVSDQSSTDGSASEDPLARVGLDLHDGPLQEVAFLVGHMRALRDDVAGGRPREALLEAVAELEGVLVALERELRELARSLTSGEAPQRPFLEALASTIALFERRSGLRVEISVEGDVNELHAAGRDAFAHVVREALENVRKHSGATRVAVELQAGAASSLEVRDDGTGFDPGAPGGGLGLAGMKARMRSCGGTLAVERTPGGGTRVRAMLPRRRTERAAGPVASSVVGDPDERQAGNVDPCSAARERAPRR
jgi:signal transduction histidine kinase